MRTTLELDDDVLASARALASSRSVSMGRVISELARKGLKATGGAGRSSGFPVFSTTPSAQLITPEDVQTALEED